MQTEDCSSDSETSRTQLCRLSDSIQPISNSNQCLMLLPNMLMKYLAKIILLTVMDACQLSPTSFTEYALHMFMQSLLTFSHVGFCFPVGHTVYSFCLLLFLYCMIVYVCCVMFIKLSVILLCAFVDSLYNIAI